MLLVSSSPPSRNPEWSLDIADTNNRGVALFNAGSIALAESLFAQASARIVQSSAFEALDRPFAGYLVSANVSPNDHGVNEHAQPSVAFEDGMDTSFEEGMENAYTTAVELMPEHCQHLGVLSATLAFNLAQARHRRRDISGASDYYNQALSILTTCRMIPSPATSTDVVESDTLAFPAVHVVCKIIIPALHNIGYMSLRMGCLQVAVASFGTALTYAMPMPTAQSQEPTARRHVGVALNSLGLVHLRLSLRTTNPSATAPNETTSGTDAKDNNNDSDKALLYLSQALAVFETLEGPPSRLVAQTMNNLGRVLLQRHDYQGALRHFEMAMTLHVETSGTDCPDYIATLFNAGQARHGLGDTDQAMVCYLSFLNHARSTQSHRDVVAGLLAVALVHEECREVEKAAEYYEESLRVGNLAWTESPHDMLPLLDRVGRFYLELKNWHRALRLYQDVLHISRSVLEPWHPDVISRLFYIGEIYREMKRFATALKVYKEGVELQKIQYGEHSIPVVKALHVIGAIYDESGNTTKALAYIQESLAKRQTAQGECHLDVTDPMTDIGALLCRRELFHEALPVLQEALRIRRVHLGDDHPDVALASYNVGLCYMERGDYDEAASCLEESLRVDTIMLGPDHEDLLETLYKLGEAHHKAGNLDRALVCFQQALSIAQQAEDRDGVATTLNNIANVYVGKGDIGRTMEYYIAAGRAFDRAGHSLSAVVVPPNWWLYAEVVHCAAAAE